MNLNPRTREIIYAATAILSPTMAYLYAENTISGFVFGLFSVIVTAVSALAFSKVRPDSESQ